ALVELQEEVSRAFGLSVNLGQCKPNQGRLDLAPMASIPKDALMFPFAGERYLGIVVRLIDLDDPPPVAMGFVKASHAGIVVTRTHRQTHTASRGFAEKSREELAIACASARIAMALSASDGTFDRHEGAAIKE